MRQFYSAYLKQNDEIKSNFEMSIMNRNEIENDDTIKNLLMKPFKCPKCERTFNSKYNVARHLRQFHADKRMFKCSICERDYKWIDSLHKHMKSHKTKDIDNQKDEKEKKFSYSYVTLTNEKEEHVEEENQNENEKEICIDLSDSKTSLVSNSSLSLRSIPNSILEKIQNEI